MNVLFIFFCYLQLCEYVQNVLKTKCHILSSCTLSLLSEWSCKEGIGGREIGSFKTPDERSEFSLRKNVSWEASEMSLLIVANLFILEVYLFAFAKTILVTRDKITNPDRNMTMCLIYCCSVVRFLFKQGCISTRNRILCFWKDGFQCDWKTFIEKKEEIS